MPSWSDRRSLLIAGAAIVFVTVTFRSWLHLTNPTIAALSFLLVVLLTATVSRLRAAVVTCVIADLFLNYFFMPPFGTFTIADPQNWVALFVFIAVSVVASSLSSALRDRAVEVTARRDELARLFDLSRDVLLTRDSTEAMSQLARFVARRFDLEFAAICRPHGTEWDIWHAGPIDLALDVHHLSLAFAGAERTLEFDAQARAYSGHQTIRVGGHSVRLVPLRLGTKPVGLLAAAGRAVEPGTLDVLAGVVAIRAGLAAGLPDPDDDWRSPVGHWHSGHGPLNPAECAGMSGRAVEAAGDVHTLLLDKTGTITLGNRQATEFIAASTVSERELADAAQLSSLADETPEGRSIVVLAKERYGLRGRELLAHEVTFVPFTAQTRMSGADMNGREIRKGATDAIEGYVHSNGGEMPPDVRATVDRISRAGGTPLVVAERGRPLGVVHLKDVVKGGIRERFEQLRAIGIRTVMITGDNPLTAASIANEAGVDAFLAEARPEDKMALIKREQREGKLVAMTGDGTNDAPALAQADVGVAMNSGTQAAKEAGNMVDLDSNPTKLIDVVEIGKQLLMTRGALTTFSIANDVAKYFAIIPAMFASAFPVLMALNIMGLKTPQSAILSAVIFNALIIVVLVPLALRGVTYRPMSAEALLRRILLVYGVGGVIVPFIGIKIIDVIITTFRLA